MERMTIRERIKFFFTGVIPERFGEPIEMWIHTGNEWVRIWRKHETDHRPA
jgi:hypothetical protein